MRLCYTICENEEQSTACQNASMHFRQLIREIEKRIIATEKQLKQGKKFERTEGPFVRCLDASLATFNVERQAYYSGTFVGNHVHRALKAENTHTPCSAPLELATKICPELAPSAAIIKDTYLRAFTLLSSCHLEYNRKKMDDDDIKQLCKQLTTYM
jgi:glutamine amidotransferase-like uncharacterized protein